jgi:hypothetical protein
MKSVCAASVLMLACAWPALAADKLPPLDPEFLEYLGSFGNDEEDWTLFTDDDGEPAAEPPPAKDPPPKRDGSKTEAAAKPAEKR